MKNSGNQGGYILFVLLIFGALISIIAMTTMMSMKNSLKKANVTRSQDVAFNIAEAGKEHALATLRSQSITPTANSTGTLINATSFGGGIYTVTCKSNTAIDTIWLTSTGSYNNRSAIVEITCKVTLGTTGGVSYALDTAFNYEMLVGGTFNWSGSGVNTGSNRIHANGAITISGSSSFTANISSCVKISRSGSGTITGNTFAPTYTTSGSCNTIGTKCTCAVATVNIPNIDLTPYCNRALTNGTVYNGNMSLTGSKDTTIAGGVLWVKGSFTISGSRNFNGSIIATDAVNISGSGDMTGIDSIPAIASVNNNITISGSGKVSGLIYAQNGSFTKSGSGDVTGSIICKNNLTKSGSWSILNYKKCLPYTPSSTPNIYEVIAWRQL